MQIFSPSLCNIQRARGGVGGGKVGYGLKPTDKLRVQLPSTYRYLQYVSVFTRTQCRYV